MNKYESREALQDHCQGEDYDLDIVTLFFGKGISLRDLPDETPEYVRQAFDMLAEVKHPVRIIRQWLNDD